MAGQPISKLFGHRQAFVRTLVVAELNASTDWECRFTDEIRARFELANEGLHLTNQQKRALQRIAHQ